MRFFTIQELTNTNTGLFNEPDMVATENLHRLVDRLLDPLRAMMGVPIIVNSGYRSPKVNQAVGGAKNSNHLYGYAADITAGTRFLNRAIFKLIKDNFEFDELIDEQNYSWIHVALKEKDNRQKILHL